MFIIWVERIEKQRTLVLKGEKPYVGSPLRNMERTGISGIITWIWCLNRKSLSLSGIQTTMMNRVFVLLCRVTGEMLETLDRRDIRDQRYVHFPQRSNAEPYITSVASALEICISSKRLKLIPGGGGLPPINRVHRDDPLDRVWFFDLFVIDKVSISRIVSSRFEFRVIDRLLG